MDLHKTCQVNGCPAFGTFHAGTIEDLKTVSAAGMNLVISGNAELLDTTTETGRYCLDHGIQVMYHATSHVHGRPTLARDISAEETELPIASAEPPTGERVIQIGGETIRYREATPTALVGCERGADGSTPEAHESDTILFWPEQAEKDIAAVCGSPNLWGYWVLDDTPGYAYPALRALYALIKRVDGDDHPVCAGHSGPTTLRNFGPGSCDIMGFYYYPILRDEYLRTLNSKLVQWTLSLARQIVPGIPFIGIFQGFWEAPDSQRVVNTADPLEPWMIRQQIEDFVREGAAGIAGYACIGSAGQLIGWDSRPELVAELGTIGVEIASTGALDVPSEPEELVAIRIQAQGHYDTPTPIDGIVPAWHIAGPFDAGGKGRDAQLPPDSEIDLSATYPGKGDTTARWKTYPSHAGCVGLVEVYGGAHHAGDCIAYATCTVTSPSEQAVQMRFGSDEDAIVWFDGDEVWRFDGGRGVVPDDDVVPVTLVAGDTSILVKVYNRGDQWGLFMRFTDLDGNPLAGLEFSPEAP